MTRSNRWCAIHTAYLPTFARGLLFKHEAEDFWAIYKVSTCAVERRRAQFFAFLAEGKSETETLELTRYSLNNHRLKTVGLRERLKVGIRAKARHSSTIPNTLLGFGSK